MPKAEVVEQFIDLETGRRVYPGTEVDLPSDRFELLKTRGCVRESRRTPQRAASTAGSPVPEPQEADGIGSVQASGGAASPQPGGAAAAGRGKRKRGRPPKAQAGAE